MKKQSLGREYSLCRNSKEILDFAVDNYYNKNNVTVQTFSVAGGQSADREDDSHAAYIENMGGRFL